MHFPGSKSTSQPQGLETQHVCVTAAVQVSDTGSVCVAVNGVRLSDMIMLRSRKLWLIHIENLLLFNSVRLQLLRDGAVTAGLQ